MANITDQLQTPSYKGIAFDYIDLSVGFQHDLAEKRFIFQDENFVQPQGRQNLTWRFSLPLSQNHPKIRDQFTKDFPALFAACIDGEPGDLVTPDIGTFRAACSSLSYSIRATMKDGVMVDVDFVRAPEFDAVVGAVEIQPTVQSALNLADQVNNAYASQGFATDDAPSPDIGDIVNNIRDGVRRGRAARDRALFEKAAIQAQFNSLIFSAHRMEEHVAARGDVSSWGLESSLRRLQLEARHAERAAGFGSKSVRKRVLSETSVDELARDLSVSPESLISLNPDLATSPIVPSGTTVMFQPGA